MQVKIGNKVFNSDDLPIMLLLSNEEKNRMLNTESKGDKYCSYNPKVISAENIKNWMEMSFTEVRNNGTDT